MPVKPEKSLPVVDVVENKFITSQTYWYIMTDLQDLLVHSPVSLNMWTARETRNKYIIYVSTMQGRRVSSQYGSLIHKNFLGMNAAW